MDNTHLLPPFLPLGRNEDGVFGVTLRKCNTHGYFAHIPWVILHAPDQTKTFAQDAMCSQATRCRVADLVCEIVESAMPASSADQCRTLKSLGRFIMDLGEMDLRDFEEFIMIRRAHRVASQINQMAARLRSDGNPPEFWTRDVEQYLDALTADVTSANCVVPIDLDISSTEDTRRGLQAVVRQFGELIWWWPEVVQATRALKARGVELAVPVSHAGAPEHGV